MVDVIRPMLAHSKPVKPADLDFQFGPYWVSPKYDGVRCLQIKAISMSRTLKPLPNGWVQKMLGSRLLDGLDGEVVVGSPTHPDCIRNTTSGVMSREGRPQFSYNVFDLWDCPKDTYRIRKEKLEEKIEFLRASCDFPIVLVPQRLCRTHAQLEAVIAENYESGYEGSIIRSFDGLYKYNRSTLSEQLLLKVKESVDSEMRVDSFEEMMHNENEAKMDERGYTKRTTHKGNKVPAGTLGKLRGIDIHTKAPITIGTGKMTADEKLAVWQNRDRFLGRIAKYRYGKHGVMDAPRFGRFIVWRDPIDL